jgi:predicted DNA-binding transcriptional regulator YafY
MPGSITVKDLFASGPVFKQGEQSTWWKELKGFYFPDAAFFESRRKKDAIVVRFSENGLERFLKEEDNIEIIGIPDPKDKFIYTFEATEPEAFYQLFKFGPQAEIISPATIKNNFKLLYQAAFNKYNNKGTL